ncbi:diacylglycerol kinase family protein [Flavobacterium agricola]|uniref:Diacylglycerol kinase family protein n=1 Tax=Flavobacterium agricola TaxID=2870839 RepID=A0ABY6M4F1_9FLAO|nr:diacylglycerol kinase family protein [Flavobacterium agricola]UYW02241.1 diacylglycerol kinase family protein [Flavobacterium agricola]
MKQFIIGRIKSVKYAAKGMFILATNEHSVISQLTAGILVTIAGFYYDLSATEWAMQCLCIGLIVTAEGLNTAIEAICDYLQPNFDPKIGFIKDIAAGAVAFAAFFALIVALIIYYPKIF